MVSEKAAAIARLEALINLGANLPRSDEWTMEHGPFHGWRAQSISTLHRTLGEKDSYTKAFQDQVADTYRSQRDAGVAILAAVREDVVNGYLARYADLVSAAVFADFIDMADHLHGSGYKDPAASLTGAVLEDGLRRIVDNAGLARKKSDGIDALNKKCFDAGLYNALTQSTVDTWRILRNSADHGKFADYTPDDVKAMIQGVRRFLTDPIP